MARRKSNLLKSSASLLISCLISMIFIARGVNGNTTCSQLIVKACEDTKMEDYATATFIPYNGGCEASPTYSKYVKSNGDPVYIFYKPSTAKWYISATGAFASTCTTNLFDHSSVIFDAAEEPYLETGDDDGEAKCYDGLGSDNKASFAWRSITITCNDSNGGGGGSGGGSSAGNSIQASFSFFLAIISLILPFLL